MEEEAKMLLKSDFSPTGKYKAQLESVLRMTHQFFG